MQLLRVLPKYPTTDSISAVTTNSFNNSYDNGSLDEGSCYGDVMTMVVVIVEPWRKGSGGVG